MARWIVRSERRHFFASVSIEGHASEPSSEAWSAIASRISSSLPETGACSHTHDITRTLTA